MKCIVRTPPQTDTQQICGEMIMNHGVEPTTMAFYAPVLFTFTMTSKFDFICNIVYSLMS